MTTTATATPAPSSTSDLPDQQHSTHPAPSQPKQLSASSKSSFKSPAKLKQHSNHLISPFNNNNNNVAHNNVTSSSSMNPLLNSTASPLFNSTTFKQMSSKGSRANSVSSSTSATPRQSHSTVNSKHPSIDLSGQQPHNNSHLHQHDNNPTRANGTVNSVKNVNIDNGDKSTINGAASTSQHQQDDAVATMNDVNKQTTTTESDAMKSTQPTTTLSQRNNRLDELLPSMQLSHSQIVSNAVSCINDYRSTTDGRSNSIDTDLSAASIAKQVTVVACTVVALYHVSNYIDKWRRKK